MLVVSLISTCTCMGAIGRGVHVTLDVGPEYLTHGGYRGGGYIMGMVVTCTCTVCRVPTFEDWTVPGISQPSFPLS